MKSVCHYHPKSRKSSHYQPQNIEQGVKVDIVGHEKDHAMTKQTIALQNTVSKHYTHLQWAIPPQSEQINSFRRYSLVKTTSGAW